MFDESHVMWGILLFVLTQFIKTIPSSLILMLELQQVLIITVDYLA